jgi:hypothetical protein
MGTPTTVGTYQVRITADNDVAECDATTWVGTLEVAAPGNEVLGLSCQASQPARINVPLTWTADALYCPSGSCTYSWSGEGVPVAPVPAGPSYSATYPTSGVKSVTVTARSGTASATQLCSVNVGNSFIEEER